ncbi:MULTISPECIES: hypothetical protein [unclassified Rhizobium]|uniref:hypothetical protein n=1 Tax=unclassified Rhizobium TaxID=2613769 RepID=UPI001A98A6FE|nr:MULTISPECIES: hypothetical protein [unclassified Rhizobium]MBX5158826.1 hypothetical protein [Rhizobium sp. NZLR8]MBX5166727.1 hypothetical protein [Rhizobium sp. NZLR4b]MBX5171258.1 hypothetical protein [Rhizobium sp. NZLR1b]MBX5182268.1 hypothetical protein [Rhizobium sp. NZLR5]MBX5190311.1 hypothetical protein [Rhizobium sp. NZLR3b]
MARWVHIGAAVTLGLASFLFPPTLARAEPAYIPLVRDYVETRIRPMVETPLVLKAIAEQNAQFGNVSEMDMRVLDEIYRSEVDQHHLQMVKLLLDKSVSHYLKTRQDASQGAIVEFFVTDSHGLNVGQSTITADYWQGDEEKYLRTFANGSREIFIDRAERNESTQMLETQASFVVMDEEDRPIGVATVTIAIDAL